MKVDFASVNMREAPPEKLEVISAAAVQSFGWRPTSFREGRQHILDTVLPPLEEYLACNGAVLQRAFIGILQRVQPSLTTIYGELRPAAAHILGIETLRARNMHIAENLGEALTRHYGLPGHQLQQVRGTIQLDFPDDTQVWLKVDRRTGVFAKDANALRTYFDNHFIREEKHFVTYNCLIENPSARAVSRVLQS